MPRPSRLLADIRPLRECPPYRRLWTGSLVSSIGAAMTAFALTLQVYRLTHSAFAVGAIGLVTLVPTLTAGIFGGSLADRVDRRKLVLITSSSLAAVSALLAVQAFAGLRQVWLIYLLAAVEATVVSVDNPARRTFTPRLLPAKLLPAGLALNQLTFQVTLVAGPALAGLITAAGGLRLCYLIDAVSFGAALYSVARLPAMRPVGDVPRRSLRAVADGLRFIVSSRPVAGAFLTDLSATVFGLPVALFPAINAERFGGNPAILGLFMASIGVGGLLSGVLSGRAVHAVRQGRAMLLAVAVWGAAFAGFAVAPWLWLTLACLALAGAADTFTVVFRGAIVQSVTPDALRGRVLAADYVVGAGGGQLGSLEAGALGSLTSPAISALAGGLVTVAAAVVIAIAMPSFARYRRPADQEEAREPESASSVTA